MLIVTGREGLNFYQPFAVRISAVDMTPTRPFPPVTNKDCGLFVKGDFVMAKSFLA
jgi:hypothetical protein